MIGSRILEELVSRGHTVTAVVRQPEKVTAAAGVNVVQGEIMDPASVAATARGTDAAVSAYSPPRTSPGMIVDATRSLLKGLA